jgi:hypothetical protein
LVTLIFAINDRFNDQGREEIQKLKENWQPGQLPARPVSALIIKRADPIIAIVFLVIAVIVINVNLDMIGIYFQEYGSWHMMPLFSDNFHQILPWINLSIGLTILLEGIKLFTSRWTFSLLIGSLAQKILSLVIGLQMFATAKIFNPEFFTDINRIFMKANQQLPADLPETICRVLVIVMIIAFGIDLLSIGVKAVRLAFGFADSKKGS